jgi:hypothetical protein
VSDDAVDSRLLVRETGNYVCFKVYALVQDPFPDRWLRLYGPDSWPEDDVTHVMEGIEYFKEQYTGDSEGTWLHAHFDFDYTGPMSDELWDALRTGLEFRDWVLSAPVGLVWGCLDNVVD